MSSPPTHPFDLVFGGFRDTRFPQIRDALGDRTAIDEFVLAGPALELLRDLRPDEGLGEGVDDFVALVHAAYLYWRSGEQTIVLDESATRALPRPGQSERPLAHAESGLALLGTGYFQVAPHIIWGQLDEESPFEPLDGWFATVTGDETMRLVACFGVHPQRPGISVVVAEGAVPLARARADGTATFSPTMPGGNAANLFAVQTEAELLLLAWNAMKSREVS